MAAGCGLERGCPSQAAVILRPEATDTLAKPVSERQVHEPVALRVGAPPAPAGRPEWQGEVSVACPTPIRAGHKALPYRSMGQEAGTTCF